MRAMPRFVRYDNVFGPRNSLFHLFFFETPWFCSVTMDVDFLWCCTHAYSDVAPMATSFAEVWREQSRLSSRTLET